MGTKDSILEVVHALNPTIGDSMLFDAIAEEVANCSFEDDSIEALISEAIESYAQIMKAL